MLIPIVFSFFINTAVIVIAAEVTGGKHAGLTNFGHYLDSVTNTKHCMKHLWGLAMFSSSQSSCATATYSGEVCHVEFIPE